jgi:hypothetical protein
MKLKKLNWNKKDEKKYLYKPELTCQIHNLSHEIKIIP